MALDVKNTSGKSDGNHCEMSGWQPCRLRAAMFNTTFVSNNTLIDTFSQEIVDNLVHQRWSLEARLVRIV